MKKHKLSDFNIVIPKSELELAIETLANPNSTEQEKSVARIIVMKNDKREIGGKKEQMKTYLD